MHRQSRDRDSFLDHLQEDLTERHTRRNDEGDPLPNCPDCGGDSVRFMGRFKCQDCETTFTQEGEKN